MGRVSREQIKGRGLSIVMDAFEEFRQQTAVGPRSEYDLMSKTQRNRFYSSHKLVCISLQRTSELWLGPMHYDGKGHLSRGPAERKVVPIAASNEDFVKVLLEAFEIAE